MKIAMITSACGPEINLKAGARYEAPRDITEEFAIALCARGYAKRLDAAEPKAETAPAAEKASEPKADEPVRGRRQRNPANAD